MENNLEKEINNTLQLLVSTMEDEAIEETASKVDEILSNKSINWKSPEEVDCLYFYENRKHIMPLIKRIFPEAPEHATWKIEFIYEQYLFVKSQIENLVDLGFGCSGDKSRWLISQYLDNCLGVELEEIPDRNSNRHHYGMPDFGTMVDWIEYIDSLSTLYHSGISDSFMDRYIRMKNLRDETKKVVREELKIINVYYKTLPTIIENLIEEGKTNKKVIVNKTKFLFDIFDELKTSILDGTITEEKIINAMNNVKAE